MGEVIQQALETWPCALPIAVAILLLGVVIRYFVGDRDFWRDIALRAVKIGEVAVEQTESNEE